MKSTGADRATSERVSGAASAPSDVRGEASFDSPRFKIRECVLSSVSVSDKVFHIRQRRAGGRAGQGRAAGSGMHGRAACRVGCSLYLVHDAPVVWLLSNALPHQRHDLATCRTEAKQYSERQIEQRASALTAELQASRTGMPRSHRNLPPLGDAIVCVRVTLTNRALPARYPAAARVAWDSARCWSPS